MPPFLKSCNDQEKLANDNYYRRLGIGAALAICICVAIVAVVLGCIFQERLALISSQVTE